MRKNSKKGPVKTGLGGQSREIGRGGAGAAGGSYGPTAGSRGSARGTPIKPDITRRATKPIKPAKPKTVVDRERRAGRVTGSVPKKTRVGSELGLRTRKNKPTSNSYKARKKNMNKTNTTLFAPDREVLSRQYGMSSKMTNKQMRTKAGKMWNLSVPKNPNSFKQARKASESDKVRYNTSEKRLNKTEKTLGHPAMWNFKPTLYKKGGLRSAKTRSFPKKAAPVKPSLGKKAKPSAKTLKKGKK